MPGSCQLRYDGDPPPDRAHGQGHSAFPTVGPTWKLGSLLDIMGVSLGIQGIPVGLTKSTNHPSSNADMSSSQYHG